MSNPLKKKRKVQLPYWPAKDFLEKATALAKEKGLTQFDDNTLNDMMLKAYRMKRAEILAKEIIP